LDALRELAENPEYKLICKNISKGHPSFEDLFQEVFLIIAEYDKQKIKEIHKKGQLKYFFTKIVMNNFNSTTSPFYSKYRKNGYKVGINDLKHIGEKVEKYDNKLDKMVDFIKKHLANKGTDTRREWYKKTLFKVYMEVGSYLGVSEKTGIPVSNIFLTINELKKEIEDKWSKS